MMQRKSEWLYTEYGILQENIIREKLVDTGNKFIGGK